MTIFKIEHRGSKWLVTSEDGSKVLGTHDSKEDAEKQLRAVEASKARHSVLEMQTFDGERDVDGKVRICVWDRFTSWGEKIKEGQRTVFNETTLGQMVDNWYARGDKLAMCANHQSAFVPQNGQPAPALAFYSALAVIRGEQVIKFASVDPSFEMKPDAAGLGDGLYGYRCEVTEYGNKLLPNFKYISPMFNSQGKDEQGEDIGYVLFDVAATNTPFQAGCEITFEDGAAATSKPGAAKMKINKKFAQWLGLEATAATKEAVQQAFARKMEEASEKLEEEEGEDAYAKLASEMEEMARYAEASYEEEEGDDGKEPPHTTMRRYGKRFAKLAKMAKLEDGPDDAEKEAKDKYEDSDGDNDGDEAKMAAELGVLAKRFGVKGGNTKELLDGINATAIPASQLPQIVAAQVKAALLETKREEEKQQLRQKAELLATRAVKGGYPKDSASALTEWAASSAQNFEHAAKSVKTFTDSAGADPVLFERLTGRGNPLGLENPSAETSAPPSRDRRVVPNVFNGVTFVEHGAHYSKVMHQWADAKDGDIKMEIDAMLGESEKELPYMRLIAADKLLQKKNPALFAAAEDEIE